MELAEPGVGRQPLVDRISSGLAELRHRDGQLSLNDWAEYFSFGGNTYPVMQTTMGQVDRESVGVTSVAGFKGNGPIFSLVLARLQAFSQVRFQWTRFQGSQPTDLFGTPELDVLERPWRGGTTSDLLARMEVHASAAGCAYVTRPRADRLSLLRPDRVTIIMGSQTDEDDPSEAPDVEIIGFAHTTSRGKMTLFGPDQVAYYAPIPDPDYRFLGMSWITPVIRDLQADSLATEHKARFFVNSATPNLAIKFDASISFEKVKQFKALLESEHKGAFNAWKTLYLGGGADPVPVGSSFKDMDYAVIQGRAESRLASAAGVPPSWVGFAEGLQGSSLNAGNFNSARRRFSDGTMVHLWTNAATSLETLLRRPPGASLWYDSRVPFMREDADDLAGIQQKQAETIVKLSTSGFTRESAIAAVTKNDFNLLVKDPNWVSVQLQQSGAGKPASVGQPATDSESPAGGAGPKVPPAARAAERKFNPAEPRDPHSGKWVGTGGGLLDAARDKLGLAKRIRLGKDEHLVGSAKANDVNGDLTAVFARIDGPDGAKIRFGTVLPEDARRWRAANLGRTVELDERGVRAMREVLADAPDAGKTSVDEYYAAVRTAHAGNLPDSEWPNPETTIASGVIRAGWGDVQWSLLRDADTGPELPGIDAPGAGWSLGFDIVPSGQDETKLRDAYWVDTKARVRALDKALADLTASIGAAPDAARAFNPAEPRIPGGPHGGEWGHGGGVAKKIAHLSAADFESAGAKTQTAVNDKAAVHVAERWKVSDADLEELAREGGEWDHLSTLPASDRRRSFVATQLDKWRAASGGPVAVAAITGVLDDKGIAYKLEDREARIQKYVHDHPGMARAAESLGHAIYSTTQAWFKERGITHVHAFRATRDAKRDEGRPFTSWASTRAGMRLEEGRTVREEDIPVDRIFSIPATGFGALDEHELVVLPLGSAIAARAFNPAEPRVPGGEHGGEWSGGGVLRDVLKLAGKIELADGEELRGSNKIDGDQGTVRLALTELHGHRSLRMGIGGEGFGSRDDEAGVWRAGPDRTEAINAERKRLSDEQDAIGKELDRLDADSHADPAHKAALQKRFDELDDAATGKVYPSGYTAKLDHAGSARLRAELSDALDAAMKEEARQNAVHDKIDRLEKQRDKLRGLDHQFTAEEDKLWDSLTAQIEALQAEADGFANGQYVYGEGTVPGEWADVYYRVVMDDDLSIGTQVTLGAVPHESGRDLGDLSGREQSATLDAAEMRKLLRLLGQYVGTVGPG